MTFRQFEASRLDIAGLGRMTVLLVHTVGKAAIKTSAGPDRLRLQGLELRWLSTVDLVDIPMPKTPRGLRIWHSPKLKGRAGIERLDELDNVDMRENGLLTDLSALSRLPKLRVLGIDGGMARVRNL